MDRTETYEAIIRQADTLFRRFGMKTSVAQIARELRMSPANIYKFFPSKRALIEAVGERRMLTLRKRMLAVTKSRKPAFERIKDLMGCVVDHFEELIEKESDLLYLDLIKDILQFELVLRETEWSFAQELQKLLLDQMIGLIREGVRTGQMHVPDPEEAALAMLDCMCRVVEPLLLMEDPPPVRAERLERQFRFLARALA